MGKESSERLVKCRWWQEVRRAQIFMPLRNRDVQIESVAPHANRPAVLPRFFDNSTMGLAL